MNLVTPSLRRPITVIVLVVAIAAAAVLALRRMPRDIFPTLGIPQMVRFRDLPLPKGPKGEGRGEGEVRVG